MSLESLLLGLPGGTYYSKDAPAEQQLLQLDRCAEALVRCREYLGYWAVEREYLEWATLERRLARYLGQGLPLYPGRTPLMSNFDTWPRFVGYTLRRLDMLRPEELKESW